MLIKSQEIKGGGGFVIKLVAANFLKVIRQYSFSYNYLSIKKEIW